MERLLLVALLIGLSGTLQAKGVYQTPEKFLSLTFSEVPEAQRILLTGDLSKRVKTILGHRYKKIRVPYWQKGCRSAWILEEIGKERFITTGFVVNSGGLEKVKVLIFRESRGWEVKHDYFGEQFVGARLSDNRLTKRIDNISGATLSVRAVTKLSKMALTLHAHVTEGAC